MYGTEVEERPTAEDGLRDAILSIRPIIKKLDFPEVANKVQGVWKNEKLIIKIMDEQTDLLEDIVSLFSGRQLFHQFESDIAIMLSPFPLVPMLICYWKPEEGMGSSLSLFFDETAVDNLGIEALYMLGTGIVRMCKQLAREHGPSAHRN